MTEQCMNEPLGVLSIEALNDALEECLGRILNDVPLKLEQEFDLLPPPVTEGEIIIGASLTKYQAVINGAGHLEWEAQGFIDLESAQ